MPNYKKRIATVFAVVVKKSDESINTTTTIQPDNDLTVPLVISRVYSVLFHILINSGATPDFKYDISVPTGATVIRNTAIMTPTVPVSTVDAETDMNVTTDGTNQVLSIWCRVIMGTTPGNIKFRWTQQTSDAGATKVLKGSSMLVLEE